ncbi:class I SAM-dependent methyltransferase [Lacinutrix sp. MedPE-SW]|uniref:THUMP-like domain-containing protein n=1 Tax=Lacinutrix sp. MedPE-SW TaxID=1860087 RepID=UPI000918FAE2|nr:class I SAM-dependent methyltransferase [Lacinutrix sp. MedPE-SW]OIQ23761.1 MAG: SAM-dependent methyltransferase [Lacinutrix sp. MedPE-SW]
MNSNILNKDVQECITNNINSNITELILKGISFPNVETSQLIEQIEAKKRSQKKLPTWFSTKNIYYPNKLNIEQTSSEITAKYKASLVSGESIIDLTGGFGVDCYYFSKQINHVTHCDINTELSKIVKHNSNKLQIKNMTCYPKNGLDVLTEDQTNYDWIYVDPSRRDDIKGKVFLLKDCLPNIPKHLDLLFKKSKNVMIKTSPLLDITSGINELSQVKEIYCVAVNNEVKELLWVLDREFNGEIKIKTTNITKQNKLVFNFTLTEEIQATAQLSEPLTYLYEPNAAILKAGAFNVIANKLNLYKLHKHSHLYTSEKLVDFPGRQFKIETIVEYNKKKFKKVFKENKANVTTRNFPESVQLIRKKLSLKDGGNNYIFFSTTLNDKKIVLICTKVD